MAVSLRLSRAGAKKAPFYHIVAADSRSPRDGKFLEAVGTYRPTSDELKIDLERAEKWIANGARPSDTVRNLIRKFKASQGAAGEAEVVAPAPAAKAAPAAEPAKKAEPVAAEADEPAKAEPAEAEAEADAAEPTSAD